MRRFLIPILLSGGLGYGGFSMLESKHECEIAILEVEAQVAETQDQLAEAQAEQTSAENDWWGKIKSASGYKSRVTAAKRAVNKAIAQIRQLEKQRTELEKECGSK